MSHELRTPLNAVLGYAQLLAMGELTDEQQRSVHQIEKAGRQLLQLVDEALEIVRVDSGGETLSLEPVDVLALVRRTLDLTRPLAAERRVELIEPTCDAAYALADDQRLRIVLLNLVTNAVVYNREGGLVEVAIREDAGRVRVSVRDTGPGLGSGELEQLFVPFERLGAERRGIDGTGLGLALAKRLMEAMGGTIGVESEPGRGSTFLIELEAASGDLDRPAEAVSARPAERRSVVAAKTVLYIDDNVMNLELVSELVSLRKEIALITSAQGRLGIDLARRHKPALILLDLHLPDMHGEEVLAELRRDERTRGSTIVVVSSDAFPDNRERLLEAGADGYLTKPLDVGAFLQLLEGLR